MSNKNWIKRAKRVAVTSNYVPAFVKVALQLELQIEKPSIELPKAQVGDPGMLAVRQRARSYSAVTVASQNESMRHRPRALPPGSVVALRCEIDEHELKAGVVAAIGAGRSRVTVAELERLLSLPYR